MPLTYYFETPIDTGEFEAESDEEAEEFCKKDPKILLCYRENTIIEGEFVTIFDREN